jgi:hypothetical protein
MNPVKKLDKLINSLTKTVFRKGNCNLQFYLPKKNTQQLMYVFIGWHVGADYKKGPIKTPSMP